MEFSIAEKKSPIQTILEKAVGGLSVYAVPLLVVVITCVALAQWRSPYVVQTPEPTPLRVLATLAEPPVDVAQARKLLAAVDPAPHWNSQLTERPVWLGLTVPPSAEPGRRRTLEFPSRHAIRMACWDASDLRLLGDATRVQSSGPLLARKSAFALLLAQDGPLELLCRGQFVGPARVSAMVWDAAMYDRSVRAFDRNIGLLDGGLVLMSVFLITAAIVNRRALYLLFAAWLFLSMRVGGLSMGWDMLWLGHAIPPDWLSRSRALSIGFYAVILMALHRSLFREALAGSRFDGILRVMHQLSLLLVVAALVLSYRQFLPVMWVIGGAILVLMCLSLVRIVKRSPTRVVFWYAGALAVSVLSNLVEIVAAATGHQEVLGIVNSVTAAMASSLLASLAFAEQMRQEHLQRLQAQADLQHTFDAAPIGLFTLDPQGNITAANPAMRRMLDLLEPPQCDSWTRQFGAAAFEELRLAAARQDPDTELELHGTVDAAPERRRRFLVKATLAGHRIEGSLQDVTEKSLAVENLRFLVDHDPLTHLLNRRGIEQALHEALSRMATDATPASVVCLDLDRFKLVNDLFGHAAGDELLRHVASRIGNCLPSGAAIARVDGDEFVAVLTGLTLAQARHVGESMVCSLGGRPYQVGDKTFPVHVSVGVVEVAPYHHVRTALLAADRACVEAKGRSRGNALVCYEKDSAVFREHAVVLQLMEQIAGDGLDQHLYLNMQPIMSLHAPYDALNFEVLLRMRDADGQPVPTPRLIHAAESTGRMGAIDRWVLGTTLRWLEAHRQQLAATQFVCLNLSGASLNDERFVQDVMQMLSDHPHVAGWICFEITESVALHDLENTRQFIAQVRGFGARVALDDFGAGYTSFAYLRELPADVLKIDGQFVVDMNDHPANVAIVETIVNLARNLGMKTIAEWAEDAGTVRTLAELSVDYVQGYVVGRPGQPDAMLTVTSAAGFAIDPAMRSLLNELQALGTAAPPEGSAPH